MSENTNRSPLTTIEAFEAGAFRVAHVSRQLLAEHPSLPVREIRPATIAFQGPATTHAKLEISTNDVDGVRAWANALGTTVSVAFYDARGVSMAFEHHEAQVTVGGVEVTVTATRHDLTEEELTAWRIAQDRTVAEGGDR
ncbi:hypothetical protein [Streptomyces justiciae]|uniref:Uncharacterized protein n=1 Tax=Streptomyces justiciae TaxID=2780140 RepID=A0ABU3M952_9ACTN|nr:hypothetical protein [Streptomyces justiciae]MDT7847248.1 hypothetical protein [Streptomyces justiciae]